MAYNIRDLGIVDLDISIAELLRGLTTKLAVMGNRYIFFSFVLICLCSCKTKQIVLPPMVISGYELTDFCALSDKQNQTVYINAKYSGVEEYWGLSSRNNDCKEQCTELVIPENVIVQPKFAKLFRAVHRKYWKKYLIIGAIGTFKTGNKYGYGHLGHNKSEFIVEKIVDVQLLLKKNDSVANL